MEWNEEVCDRLAAEFSEEGKLTTTYDPKINENKTQPILLGTSGLLQGKVYFNSTPKSLFND